MESRRTPASLLIEEFAFREALLSSTQEADQGSLSLGRRIPGNHLSKGCDRRRRAILQSVIDGMVRVHKPAALRSRSDDESERPGEFPIGLCLGFLIQPAPDASVGPDQVSQLAFLLSIQRAEIQVQKLAADCPAQLIH